MRKDEMKSTEYCPDCMESEETNADPEANGSDECCSCCCSCSESTSPSEGNDESSMPQGSNAMVSLEQRKKELLSNLTILQTNREQTSLQQVLQFVEALSHSPDFLRRYNMQEDFCMECLLTEPTCTCCVGGMSQLNLNDQPSDSCEECRRDEAASHERYPSQGCADCDSSAKTSNPRGNRAANRRERRRRRRPRNIRHNLPRVSLGNASTNNAAQLSHMQQEDSRGSRRADPLNHEDCHRGSCEECIREDTSRRGSESRRYPQETNGTGGTDSDYCEECAREDVPLASCMPSCCSDCESKSQRFGVSRSTSFVGENSPECSCSCCVVPPEDSGSSKDDKKRHKPSDKSDCTQKETRDDRSFPSRNESEECSCEDCRENSECSDESCSECNTRPSKVKKKKK